MTVQEAELRQTEHGLAHVIVGAGDAPSVILAVGARVHSTGDDWGAYTVDEPAQRYGAGVSEETTKPQEAYAPFRRPDPSAYRDGWLP